MPPLTDAPAVAVAAASAVVGAGVETAVVASLAAVVAIVLAALVVRLGRARRRDAAMAFARALELAPDAMVVVDPAGVITHANAQVHDLFGYDPEELVGQSVDVLVPDRLVGAHQRHRARYAEHPRARPMGAGSELAGRRPGGSELAGRRRDGSELAGRRRDGSELPIDVSLNPVDTPAGPRYVAAVRDATERREAEADRALMAAVVASSHDAIYSLGVDGQIRTWNEGAERLYGYAAHEVVGRSVDILVPSSRPGEASALLGRVLHGEPVQRHRTTRRRADGAVVDVALSYSPLIEGGQITGVSVVARDITAEKATEEALAAAFERERQASEQLRRSDELKDEFLDATSHELRTPLAAITGFVELLQESEVDRDLRAELLGRIHRNALQMRAMVDRLLDFSRLRAGKVHIGLRPVNLADAVRRAVAVTPVTEAHPVDVAVPAEVTVLADIDGLDHVLTNLLDNAARYSPAGTAIAIAARELDDRVEVSVVDRGVGIPAAEIPMVFDRFYRGDGGPGEQRGVGIGLAIVRHYVELQGGEVRIDSDPGRGTRVTFTLLRTSPDAVEAPSGTQDEERAG